MRTPLGARILAVGAILVLAGACDDGEQELRGAQKVTICHATGSASNPFVQNQPNVSPDLQGHTGHPNDIIPPFEYVDDDGNTQQFPGLNWDAEGQAIYNNGCNPVEPIVPTEPPEPTEPTVTEPASSTSEAVTTSTEAVTSS